MAVRVNPSTVAELLLLELDAPLSGTKGLLHAIDAVPLTPEIYDAATRLAECLRSSFDARVLGRRSFVRSSTVPCAGHREPP